MSEQGQVGPKARQRRGKGELMTAECERARHPKLLIPSEIQVAVADLCFVCYLIMKRTDFSSRPQISA